MTLAEQLYPINRSLTGDGVRQSLRLLQTIADFEIHEIPSGTQIFDWTVPDEWRITGGRLECSSGVIADYAESNLRIMGYSTPIDREMTYGELHNHLHTHRVATAIPYRTSYYKPDWGFCLRQNEMYKLDRCKTYHARIDAEHFPGSMTYGECFIPGKVDKTYLVSTYCCHPSMYNDNISGMITWARLLALVQRVQTYYSYHFFIAPETLGMLSLLQRRADFFGAMVVHCAGSDDDFVIKQSWNGNSEMDKAAAVTMHETKHPYRYAPFDVNGSDERQLQAPAFRIPTVTIARGNYYKSDWYHNSNDNQWNELAAERTFDVCANMLRNLEHNRTIKSLYTYGEPQLGRRGLYPQVGGNNQDYDIATIAKWILHLDGGSLADVAQQSGYPMQNVIYVYRRMVEEGLIDENRVH